MKNILLVWDHEDVSDKLLEKSNNLALPFLAKVHVVVFVSSVQKKKFEENNSTSLENSVKERISAKFDQALKISSTVVVDQDIVRWIIKYSTNKKMDLLIKTGQRSEKLFHTPEDWQLIRQVNCPILITSAKKWKSKPIVLASVDINNDHKKQKKINTKTLVTAEHFSNKNNSELHLAYSIPITKALTELDIVEPSEVIAKKGEKMDKLLKSFAEKNKIKLVKTHILAGDVAETVPKLAQKLKADLVVMGSVGRTGVKGFLLGNTAERVLHNLRTDVLVVKPD